MSILQIHKSAEQKYLLGNSACFHSLGSSIKSSRIKAPPPPSGRVHMEASQENEFATLRVDVRFYRRFMYYLLTLYIPSALLMIIAYASLFFNPLDFNSRIVVALTALLVLSSLFTQVRWASWNILLSCKPEVFFSMFGSSTVINTSLSILIHHKDFFPTYFTYILYIYLNAVIVRIVSNWATHSITIYQVINKQQYHKIVLN